LYTCTPAVLVFIQLIQRIPVELDRAPQHTLKALLLRDLRL
jgi:hypothetical protein